VTFCIDLAKTTDTGKKGVTRNRSDIKLHKKTLNDLLRGLKRSDGARGGGYRKAKKDKLTEVQFVRTEVPKKRVKGDLKRNSGRGSGRRHHQNEGGVLDTNVLRDQRTLDMALHRFHQDREKR